jgi:hypothetical protein
MIPLDLTLLGRQVRVRPFDRIKTVVGTLDRFNDAGDAVVILDEQKRFERAFSRFDVELTQHARAELFFQRWLGSIERGTIIIAALLAAFPVVQWWSERADRRLDRVANITAAVETCERFDQELSARTSAFDGESAKAAICLELRHLLEQDQRAIPPPGGRTP